MSRSSPPIRWAARRTTRKPSRRPSRRRRHPPTRIVTTPGPRRVDWPRPRGRTPTLRRPVPAASKDAQQAASVAAAAKPRDETLAEIESAAVAVEERSRQATTALAEASKQLAAAEEASSQLQKELKRTPPASIGDRALRKAVDEVTEAAAKAAAARRGGRESTNDVKALVDQAVDDFFDGDRVGRFDYALQAAGAKVVPSLTSEPYTPRGAIIPTKVWHALGLDAGVGRAADALSSSNEFGRCFAFRGSEGKLTVRLSRPVRPTHFSVEHLHAALCDPARNANCSSAPQQMEVVGRSGDGDVVEFGSFSYAASSDAPTVQTFAAASLGERFDAVTLRVKSNHGHPDYTCLYRVRVHGDGRCLCGASCPGGVAAVRPISHSIAFRSPVVRPRRPAVFPSAACALRLRLYSRGARLTNPRPRLRGPTA